MNNRVEYIIREIRILEVRGYITIPTNKKESWDNMKRIYLNNEKSNYYIDNNLDVYNDSGKKMKPILWCQGRYEMYSFSLNGKKIRRLRHRLIGEYFIPTPNNKNIDELQINHIDGNKLNNRIENLEWVTMEENIEHSFDNKLSSVGGTPYKRLTVENTITGEIKEYPSIRQASLNEEISIASLSIKSNKSDKFFIKHYKIKMLDCNI